MDDQELLKKINNVLTSLSRNPIIDYYKVVAKEFGYFDMPKKRSLSDLSDFDVLYRGFRDKYFLEDFLFVKDTKKVFIGYGNYGRGIYSTKDRNIARGYTGICSIDENNILKFYIKDFNMIEYHLIEEYSQNIHDILKNNNDKLKNFLENKFSGRAKIFIEYIKKLQSKKQDIANELISNDLSALAVILGYDIIDLRGCSSEPNFLILNRSKVHVLDIDYDRILGESKRYKKVDPEKLTQRIQKGE